MLVLYILMRTDLASMNPGKAVAQGAHAANQFIYSYEGWEDVEKWEKETVSGFGTTIVLEVDEATMRKTIQLASSTGVLHDTVHDPGYPVRDGEVTHLIPLDTCGYIFGDKEKLRWLVGDLPLMG